MGRIFSDAKPWTRTAAVLAIAVMAGLPPSARALAKGGAVFSFGWGVLGQTGLGIEVPGGTYVATPIDATNLAGKTITQVAAGGEHSLLLAGDGTVFAFGSNSFGRTGLGTASGHTLIATPIDTANLAGKTITQVAAGDFHSLLLADDGTVFSFGWDIAGQTGLGTTSGSTLTATQIDTTNLAGKTITQVAAGDSYSLLLADDGTVFSFGDDHTHTATLIAAPIDTTNLAAKTITQVAAGGGHSLLLADDGIVYSFGNNSYGQTGLGMTSLRTLVATPIDTTNLADKTITQVAAGREHSLLLADDGTVFSFGSNLGGLTGLGRLGGLTLIATPIDTTNLEGKTIVEVAAGDFHSLLLADDGTVFSFGKNQHGQTGAIGLLSVPVATPIITTNLAGLRVTGISAGGDHSLLLAVPEPGGAALILLAGLAPLVARRRR